MTTESLRALRRGIRRAAAWATLLLAALAWCASANEWSLQINTISRHAQNQCGSVRCNENNYGLGVQFDRAKGQNAEHSITAGTFINSLHDRSYYTGGVSKYKWGSLGLGVFYGAIYYPSERTDLWPALLPLISLDSQHVGLNLIYLPSIDPKIVAAWFLQLRVPLSQ